MELHTAAVLVAIASPVIMTAVAWGTYTARVKAAEEKALQAYAHAERAHERIDTLHHAR